jgi:hypothetical protein
MGTGFQNHNHNQIQMGTGFQNHNHNQIYNLFV